MKILTGILLISAIMFLQSCHKESNVLNQKCSNTNKVDSLIIQITNHLSVFTPMEGIDSKRRYLVLNHFKSKLDSITTFGVLFTVARDSSAYKPGTITLDSVKFNSDSNKVFTMLGYYFGDGRVRRATTIEAEYLWDTVKCTWQLRKTSTAVH